jgi:hypothetical protein
VSSSYPVPPAAVPVSAGMIVAVPLGLLASPLKGGRGLGDGDRSALVVGGTDRVRTRDGVAFCKVVAVAEARVKRGGQVRAKGSPVHHATLGPLEEKAGPGRRGRDRRAGAAGCPVREGKTGKAPGQGVHAPGDRAGDADAGRASRGRDRGAGGGPGAGAKARRTVEPAAPARHAALRHARRKESCPQ